MKKKLLSLVMATAMILSLAVPAFATGWFEMGTAAPNATPEITFNAKTFVPTISLAMPTITSNPVILNPYKIAFNLSADENKINGQQLHSGEETRQIISPTYYIKNDTDVDMNFAISTNTTLGGTLNLVQDEHIALDETGNKAVIKLVVSKNSEELASTDFAAAIANTALRDMDAFDAVNNEILQLKSGEVKTSNDTNATRVLAKKVTAANSTYLKLQFAGEIARTPTVAWTASDTLSTVVTFTFTPISAPDFAVGIATPAANGVAKAASGINDITINLPTVNLTTGAVNGQDIYKSTSTVTAVPSNFTVAYSSATAANWAALNKGLVNATVTNGATPTMKLAKDDLAKLPIDGQSHDYHVLLSFDDKNGVPRTLDVTIPLMRNS